MGSPKQTPAVPYAEESEYEDQGNIRGIEGVDADMEVMAITEENAIDGHCLGLCSISSRLQRPAVRGLWAYAGDTGLYQTT